MGVNKYVPPAGREQLQEAAGITDGPAQGGEAAPPMRADGRAAARKRRRTLNKKLKHIEGLKVNDGSPGPEAAAKVDSETGLLRDGPPTRQCLPSSRT